jgi:hypothetical protein
MMIANDNNDDNDDNDDNNNKMMRTGAFGCSSYAGRLLSLRILIVHDGCLAHLLKERGASEGALDLINIAIT